MFLFLFFIISLIIFHASFLSWHNVTAMRAVLILLGWIEVLWLSSSGCLVAGLAGVLIWALFALICFVLDSLVMLEFLFVIINLSVLCKRWFYKYSAQNKNKIMNTVWKSVFSFPSYCFTSDTSIPLVFHFGPSPLITCCLPSFYGESSTNRNIVSLDHHNFCLLALLQALFG